MLIQAIARLINGIQNPVANLARGWACYPARASKLIIQTRASGAVFFEPAGKTYRSPAPICSIADQTDGLRYGLHDKCRIWAPPVNQQAFCKAGNHQQWSFGDERAKINTLKTNFLVPARCTDSHHAPATPPTAEWIAVGGDFSRYHTPCPPMRKGRIDHG